jgi:hypothetical protein
MERNFYYTFRDILNYLANVDLNSVAKYVNDTTSADYTLRKAAKKYPGGSGGPEGSTDALTFLSSSVVSDIITW